MLTIQEPRAGAASCWNAFKFNMNLSTCESGATRRGKSEGGTSPVYIVYSQPLEFKPNYLMPAHKFMGMVIHKMVGTVKEGIKVVQRVVVGVFDGS